MANPKLNPHVFHDLYSNGFQCGTSVGCPGGYFPYRLFVNYSYNKNTIHYKRAIEGYSEEKYNIITFFKNEDEALRYYKGRESSLQGVSSDKFCKNYFTFTDSEFSKYRNLFHGMVKGFKVKHEISEKIKGKGSGGRQSLIFDVPELYSDTEWKEEKTINGSNQTISRTYQNPFNEPAYYSIIGNSNGGLLIDGKDPQPISKQSPAQEVTIVAKGVNQRVGSGGGIGTNPNLETYIKVDIIAVYWTTSYEDYDSEAKSVIDIDSTEVFNISEFENRIPGNLSQYNTTFYTESNESSNSRSIWERYYLTPRSSERPSGPREAKGLFYGSWEFNPIEYKRIFNPPDAPDFLKKFTRTSTYINDPVVMPYLPTYNQNFAIGSNNEYIYNGGSKGATSFSNQTKRLGGGNQIEIINRAKDYRIFEDKKNLFTNFDHETSVKFTEIFYIKSEKKFMCFVEFGCSFSSNNNLNNPTNYYLLGNFFQTTNDFAINIQYPSNPTTSTCSTLIRTETIPTKEKIEINIFGNKKTIEVWQSKKELSTKYNKCSENDNIYHKYVDIKSNFDVINSIELIPWKKEDFDPKNTFPKKVS